MKSQDTSGTSRVINFLKMVVTFPSTLYQRGEKSLRWKILLGYLVIAGLLMFTSGWAIYNFFKLNRAINDIMVASYRSVGASQKMIEALERQDSAALMFLFGSSENSLDIFITNQQEFSKWYAVAEGNITFSGEPEILRSINDGFRLYLHLYEQMRAIYLTRDPESSRRFYLEKLLPQFNRVKQVCHYLLSINQDQMAKADSRAKADARKAIFSTTLVSIFALFLALIFGYKVSAIIITPTLRLTKGAQRIGEGNLDEQIIVNTKDEIGRLAEEFNRMALRLKEYDQSNIDRLIAERRRAKAIVRSIPDPLIVVDGEYRFISINFAAEKVFQISERQAQGTHILEMINNEAIFQSLKECAETKLPVRYTSMERALTLKVDDNIHYYLLEATPVEDQEGSLLGVVVFMGDVTHLKEVDQMKSDFVSTASHEFRTPLTSIAMSVGLLLDRTIGDINGKQEQLLQVIQEDCERLNNLVSELLDLSRMKSGKIEMTKEVCRLANIVEASIRPLRMQLDENQIVIEIDPGLKKLPMVKVDSNRITWVFINLVSNAIRYTPKGGKITIRGCAQGNRVLASVSDTGIGIPKEYQAKIFDKFIQIDGSENAGGGAGLGLAIIKEIIKAHGGAIWVESEPGIGSTFTFSIPVSED